MSFLHNIKNSCYNPAFYAALRERTLGSSFKYFFSFVAILAFILAFVLGSGLAPAFSSENLRKLVALYPAELTLTVKGGLVSTNVVLPYSVKAGAEIAEKSGHGNLAVIDTEHDFSQELFRQYDSIVWIGRNFVASAKNRSQVELTDMSRAPDFALDQARLLRWADLIGSHHLALSLGLFAALFLSFYGFFVFKLLWLAILALVILSLGKVKKVSLSYRNSFQIALHAATVPLILDAVFVLNGLGEPFLFFYSLIVLVIVFVNLKGSPYPVV